MTTFEYNFDSENLEIFPKEIWQNPNIVFHGTSEYHSGNIEANGFKEKTIPFSVEAAKLLIDVLQSPEVLPFDKPNASGKTRSKALENYLKDMQVGGLRLSFAYLSYSCVLYSSGRSKGGQVFNIIRDAKTIIESAIEAHADIKEKITGPIESLFQLEEEIANSKGVVYAIELEPPYKGIEVALHNIYSDDSIGKDSIIGKVIVPENIDMSQFDSRTLMYRSIQKLNKPGNLGAILD